MATGRKIDWKLVPQSDELLHLDSLRFVAACGIIATHVQGLVNTRPLSDGFGIFVDLFFVISGFVIAYVYSGRMKGGSNYRAFLLRRIARLGPLHWATLAAFIVMGVIAKAIGVTINTPGAFDLDCVPANIAMLHSTGLCPHYSFNGPSWSISAEMLLYLAAPVIFVIVRKPWTGIGALAAVWAGLSIFAGTEWLSWTTTGGVLRALPSFLFGALLFYQKQHISRLPASLFFPALAILFAGVLANLSHVWLLGMVYAVVICAIRADLGRRAGPVVRAIAPLGQLTYSLYMLHLPVLIAARFSAQSLGLTGAAYPAVMGAAVMAIFLIAWISHVLFEEPCRRWISHLGTPRRNVEDLRAGGAVGEPGGPGPVGGKNDVLASARDAVTCGAGQLRHGRIVDVIERAA